MRASGEPYLAHPFEVALVLAEMKMDAVAIAAGLLHDFVEDTRSPSSKIARNLAPRSRISSTASPRSARFISHARRKTGRKPPQNAARHDRRYPRHHRQARRPPAQHAHALPPAGRPPANDLARNPGDLCASCQPPRYGENPRRVGGPGLQLSRCRRPTRNSKDQSKRIGRSTRHCWRKSTGWYRRKCGRPAFPSPWKPASNGLLDSQKLKKQRITIDQVYDLLALRITDDAREELLCRTGSHPPHVASCPRPDQRLHCDAAAEYVPVVAHFRHQRRRGRSRSRFEPRRCIDCGRRHRGALEI